MAMSKDETAALVGGAIILGLGALAMSGSGAQASTPGTPATGGDDWGGGGGGGGAGLPAGAGVSQEKIDKIWRILGQYESAQNYGAVNLNKQGGVVVEFSYGWNQANSRASMRALFDKYIALGGAQAKLISDYINAYSTLDQLVLAQPQFVDLIKALGSDPTMQQAQKEIFGSMYYAPALATMARYGWTLPATALAMINANLTSGPVRIEAQLAPYAEQNNNAEVPTMRAFLQYRSGWLKQFEAKLGFNMSARPLLMLQTIETDPQLDYPVMVRSVSIAGGVLSGGLWYPQFVWTATPTL